jgi:hypothetical protein
MKLSGAHAPWSEFASKGGPIVVWKVPLMVQVSGPDHQSKPVCIDPEAPFDGLPSLLQDTTPIKPVQAPKAVTVEDSFKSCASPAAAAHVIKVLAPDLLARLREESEVSSP